MMFNSNSGIEWNIIVLHSSIGAEQQLEIFRNSGPNIRKIILSTNIAESSITVPDVVYGKFISFDHNILFLFILLYIPTFSN